MKRIIFIVILVSSVIGMLIFNFCCSIQSPTDELQNNFTKCQIKDLEKITSFFKNQICKDQAYDFEICFKEFFSQVYANNQRVIWGYFDFDKQQELYGSISKSTFDEIWSFSKYTRYKDKGEFKSICSSFNGKYQKFVSEVGINNESIKKYASGLAGKGAFEDIFMLLGRINENPKNFDFSDPNIQLILSVHCLSLIDLYKRREPWKDLNNN